MLRNAIKFLANFNLKFLFNFSFLIKICKKAFIFALVYDQYSVKSGLIGYLKMFKVSCKL